MTRIDGYAVVCEAGCIADADGRMPRSLHSPAEWAFFQSSLDAADIVVLGRKSHEATPNVKGRRRLVLSRRADTGVLPIDNQTWQWNPVRADLIDAVEAIGEPNIKLAVVGGTDTFGEFLSGRTRFSAFHLSQIKGVRLLGGRPAFPTDFGDSPEACLTAAGFQAGPLRRLDDRATVATWRPARDQRPSAGQ